MNPVQQHSAGCAIPFTDEELFAVGPQRTYTGQYLREIAFPLGGIGTGSISMSGSGQLIDWEIFNRPNQGYRPACTFFSLFAQAEGEEPVFRVLEGRLQPPYMGAPPAHDYGAGISPRFGSGLLRMAQCSFTGYFPFCLLEFADESVPVELTTEAWSPFIPLNDEDSSLPVAIFDVTLTNTADQPVKSTVALGLENVIGWPQTGEAVNEGVEGEGYRGIVMSTQKHPPDSPHYGTLALLTAHEQVTWELEVEHTRWFDWFERGEHLLDEFGATGEFAGFRDTQCGDQPVAHLGLQVELAPGESRTVTFVLAWLMPNFEKYWDPPEQGSVWQTYPGTRWQSAHEVARYVLQNMARLQKQTRAFAEAFFSSTLPTHVLDAVSSQMSILRTPTVTRLPDGTLYGFEGCNPTSGCCQGTCSHVWSYAQTIAHLFPQLERGMRELEFAVNLREQDGRMQFRTPLPPGTPADFTFHAAIDGQMGNVLRTYREWQLCGDDDWLRKLWPRVKKALEYAWVEWDADRDGLVEGVHHNTLDIEFHGPNTMCGSMYLAALRAGEEMARRMGDEPAAQEYRQIFESGSQLSEEQLFNGAYYQQIIADPQAPYQFGPGCMTDQMLGQWHAWQYGLGYLYDPAHVRSALAAVFRHNFRESFFDYHNPHRVYALNDDMGLLLCTWPRGGRPRAPVLYAFEVWMGEAQVGPHLIAEGFLREGLTICKARRDRHDGSKRNPWNEFECGSHYARAMANYSYLLALAGFRYSAPERTLWLEPHIFADDFRCFFCVDGAWGMVYHQRTEEGARVTVDVLEGELNLERIVLGSEVAKIPDGKVTPEKPIEGVFGRT